MLRNLDRLNSHSKPFGISVAWWRLYVTILGRDGWERIWVGYRRDMRDLFAFYGMPYTPETWVAKFARWLGIQLVLALIHRWRGKQKALRSNQLAKEKEQANPRVKRILGADGRIHEVPWNYKPGARRTAQRR